MLPLPDFEDISYLKNGSPIQQKAHALLIHSKILYHLKKFRPVVTGSLPLDIFIEGKSDLDIICETQNLENVEKILLKEYAGQELFSSEERSFDSLKTLLCRFKLQDFLFEIFCQPRKIEHQLAYRHMVIEYKLLQRDGLPLKTRITELKNRGLKTEPAFALALGLKGDPYQALLLLEEDLGIRRLASG